MRVLHLTRDFPPRNAGGISTAVGGLVSALARSGVRCRVVSFDGWRPTRQGSEPPRRDGDVLRVTSPSHREATLAFAREEPADVVHVHDGLLWAEAAGLGADRSLFTLHVAHGALRRARGLAEPNRSELAQAEALRGADVVTVPCEALLTEAPERGRVVPLGTDAVEAATTRERSGLLFAARLADIKGVTELFDAMERVCLAQSDLHLRLAAGLIENRKAERRRRRRFEATASERLRAATTWLGWLSREALADELDRAAILVAPSWHETFGLTVLEAMAHGVAVIASDVPGHASLIEHRRTGWLVPPRDPGALAQAITHLSSHPAEARALGEAAAREAREHWTWAARVRAWISVYG